MNAAQQLRRSMTRHFKIRRAPAFGFDSSAVTTLWCFMVKIDHNLPSLQATTAKVRPVSVPAFP